MRDIASNRIRGPEAILVAAVSWWLDTDPSLRVLVERALEAADPARFTSMHEWDLGASCGAVVAEADQIFWDRAKRDPGVKHIVEQAVRSIQTGVPTQTKIDFARTFIRRLVLSEAGRIVKDSGFLERNAAAISAARRSRRVRRR